MNRKQFLSSMAGVAMGVESAAAGIAADAPKASLSLTILSPSIRIHLQGSPDLNLPTRSLHLSPTAPHLIVAIQNVSPQSIKIWDEGSSWGFSNLTLEIDAMRGKLLPDLIKVERKRDLWLANEPIPSILTSGEMVMREITLERPNIKGGDPSQIPWPYKGFPLALIETNDNMTVPPSSTLRMRAIFRVGTDARSKQEGVWTGKVVSPVNDYVIYWTDFPG